MIEEIIQMQKEEDIIYNSMFWSYMLLTEQTTLEKIFEKDEEFGLIFNPDDITKEINIKGRSRKFNPTDSIDVLIEYFTELEEYEKCADLVNAKKLYKKKNK